MTTASRGSPSTRPSLSGRPENPKLYDVSVEAESDRVQERIGFRTIEASGQKILLNGKPVFLRGVSIHAEAPFRGRARLFRGRRPRAPQLGQGTGLQLRPPGALPPR